MLTSTHFSSHPLERARERYGLDLTPADLQALVEHVKAKRVGIIREDSQQIIAEASLHGQTVRFVFLRQGRNGHGVIATFLTRTPALPHERRSHTSKRGRRASVPTSSRTWDDMEDL